MSLWSDFQKFGDFVFGEHLQSGLAKCCRAVSIFSPDGCAPELPRFRIASSLAVCVALLALCGAAGAQNPQLRTRVNSRFPTVVFTSVLWSADPPYYSIAVDATGTATYQSAPDSVGKTGVPYTLEFQVSDRTRRTTFNVARQLDYFAQQEPVPAGSPDATTVKTLSYHDAGFHHQITFSTPSDSEVQELTSIFEEISETLESGRRITYFRQHNPARLDGELGRLQDRANHRSLRELQVITPVLRSLASDSALDSSLRAKASALLDRAPH